MFYKKSWKERIKELERRIEELGRKERELKRELEENRVLTYIPKFISAWNKITPAISLESLQNTQQKIMDYLNVELKTTQGKVELVAKEKKVYPEEDLKGKEVKLDKRENCKVCPKCGNKEEISINYNYEENVLEKYCLCGYAWQEDCLDKKKEIKSKFLCSLNNSSSCVSKSGK